MPEWLTFLLADTSALQLVFWIVAIGFLVAAIIKLWPAIRKLVTIVDAVTDLPQFIVRTDAAIADIHHEVHYNNGTSVKDQGRRTENAVGRVEIGVRGLYTEVDAMKAEVIALREADDEIRATSEERDERLEALEHTIPKREVKKLLEREANDSE